MAIWQRVDPNGALVGVASLAPAEPGYSASIAASRAIAHGRWLVEGALEASSEDRLSSQTGHIGLTLNLPGRRPGFLQATLSAGFAGGNSVMLDSGLWPESEGTRSLVSAGLRWTPSPLTTFQITASESKSSFPIGEQEIGMNSALSPALCLSIGLHTQQYAGTGTLATAAMRWLPRAGSPLAITFEGDVSHGFWYQPFSDEPVVGGTQAPGQIARYSGLETQAEIDAPIASTLTLHLGASFAFRDHASAPSPLEPLFSASLSRQM
jgi:hypothetical protein